jgi:hypothetical protein
MTEPTKDPTEAAAETELSDAALQGIAGGNGIPLPRDHRLTWSEILTDPNLAVNFDPDVLGNQSPVKAPAAMSDEKTTPPAVPTANW